MPQIGPLEILVVFIVALIVFGPTKLPQVGRQVGRALREFRRFQESLRRDLDDALRDEEEQTVPTLPPKDPQRDVEAAPDPPAPPAESASDESPSSSA